jgi:Cu/Ag efflux pump CusA
MTRWIIGASLKFRRLVLAVAVGLMALGITQFRDIPVQPLPEFAPTRVEIQTESLGLSAEEVEQLITNPLEQEFFNGLPWLQQIKSNSIPGLSSIDLRFEPGTDVMAARQVVQERLTMVPALPAASSKPPFVIQPVSSTSRLMLIGLSSKNLSQLDVGVLARWKLQPRLLGIPGVANVAIWGHRDRQLLVHVDPNRLQENGVTMDQVIRTTGNALWVSPLTFVEASTPGTGGFLDTANQRIDIQHTQPIKTSQDLAKVAVEGVPNKHLGDVAEVVEDHQPLIGDAVVNEQPNMLLVVERFPNTSVTDVTRAVEAALDDMRPGLGGLQMNTNIFRPASFVQSALHNLTWTIILGLALLVLVLGAFLFSWRSALVSIVTITVSLATVVAVLAALDVTANLMIFAGLVMALAVVVDDAVVGVDNVRRRLRERDHEMRTFLEASAEMRGPVMVATLIALVPVVPVLLVGGVSGSFLRPLALSYGLAILASMVVALTIGPALAAVLLSKSSRGHEESPLARWLARGYTAVMARVIRRPVWSHAAAGLVLLVAAAGFATLPLLGGQPLTPALQDRNLLIRWDATPGASLPEMNRITAMASSELRSVSGVREVGALVGRAVSSDQVSSVSSGQLWVTLDPAADYDRTVTAVQNVVSGYPGLSRDVMTYSDQRMRELDTTTGEPLVVRVYGNDYNVLRTKADEVVQALSGVQGVVAPRVKAIPLEPTVEIEVFIDKAAGHGIKPGEVRRAAATLVSGITAGSLFEEQKVFNVVVRGTPATRANLATIRDLMIDTPNGGHVRLGDVADVRIKSNPADITHDAVSRSIDVVADVQGRSLGAVTSDVKGHLQRITFPREHHLEVLPDAAARESNQQRTLLYVIAAAIVIFFLLQAGFGSWKLAGLFFLFLPAALAGGLLVAVLGRNAMSVVSLLGLLPVLAIATRAGFLQIKHYQRLELEAQRFGPDLALRGAQERFEPIVTTVLATGAALLPLVIFGSVAGLEAVSPMAAVILGGLASTALFLLFVLPALYLRYGSGKHEPETRTSGDPVAQGA